MTRQDYIWVAIRIFGIYLLVMAVTWTPSIIRDTWGTITFRRLAADERAREPDEKAPESIQYSIESAARGYAATLITDIARMVIYTAIGLYMVLGGKRFFRILCPPEPAKGEAEAGEQAPATPPGSS